MRALDCFSAGFNPRLREGGDLPPVKDIPVPMRFNPRLREGGDGRCLEIFTGILVFQSTPPRGRRLSRMEAGLSGYRFNPRLREGGDIWMLNKQSRNDSFNPRLREGGDQNPSSL